MKEGLAGSMTLQQLSVLAEQYAASVQLIRQAFAEGLLACPALAPVEDQAAAIAVWQNLHLQPEAAQQALLGRVWTAVDGCDALRLALVLHILITSCQVEPSHTHSHLHSRMESPAVIGQQLQFNNEIRGAARYLFRHNIASLSCCVFRA